MIKYHIEEFIESAYAECRASTDIGDQMHRRAIAGRPLVVHVHGWDETANAREGGMAVTLRVEGQYVDRGNRFTGETRAEANEFADAVRAALAEMAPPVPGPIDAVKPAEIIAARAASGLTQTAAAAILGKSLACWQKWENGTRRMDPILLAHFKRETGQ